MSTTVRPVSHPTDLRTEYESTPTNLDPTTTPRFSWRIETDRRGARQDAYRLVVGRSRDAVASGDGDLWDSEYVQSSTSTSIDYDGPSLAADETYYWSVKVWTDAGETDWADPARFVTALRTEDWTGDWISHQPGDGDTNGWRSQWHRADSTSEAWVQVDLGEPRDIASIGLHPASPVTLVRTPDGTTVTRSWRTNPLAGFGFPEAYRIEISDDPSFDDATEVASITGDESTDESDEDESSDVSARIHDDLDASGRYVRITATDLDVILPLTDAYPRVSDADRKVEDRTAWKCFALAGLTVQDPDENDLARGCEVEASSSVETDTWGRDHVVNDHLESRVASTSPLLRTEFTLDKPVRSARIHVAAVGYGELYVNGDRIGTRQLDPAWTDYEKRVLYSSHDVEDELDQGENALGLWLGRGWFSKSASHWVSDGSPRARAVLSLEFEDGSTRSVTTDDNWQAAPSPLLENDIYDGERYDARQEEDGWNEPGFDGSGWIEAGAVDAPGGVLRPERIESMGIVDTVAVAETLDHPDGPILDFGQNLTGWLELEITDPEHGDEVVLRHAEALTEDGDLSTTDLRTADATDIYVARGETTERYEPRFTYHGFRYAQVTGYPGTLDPDDVTAKVVTTAMGRRGSFACSNDDLNQLQHNAVWGLRGNTHSIPEDCPQRDERFGWTGDAQISTRSLLFNFDAVRFEEKWARDHDDVASEMGFVTDVIPDKGSEDPADPTWSITRVMIPWYLYQHDGDERVLRDQYEGMRDYVDYWYSVTEDGIISDEYGKYGDWLAFENIDGRVGLPHDLFNTAFLYQVTDTFAKIANVLDVGRDAETYRERAATIADAFNDTFFDEDAGMYGPGTQSSYSVPLFLGLVPEHAVDRVAENLAEKVRADGGKLQTGFLGTRPLIHTLADHGYAELAYTVVSQPEQPGWVYMARNGATTMWERWNSDESVGSGMNSLNHSPFTHISEFFYEVLAGIHLGDQPVTEHVTISPSIVDDLEWVDASFETRNGNLAVSWERDGTGYDLMVTIPWNGQASLILPDAADATVTESGTPADEASDGIQAVERDGDRLVVEVSAGTYDFSITE